MNFFEEEQEEVMGMAIQERLSDNDYKGFLRLAGTAADMREYPMAKMQSTFPMAFKEVQQTDISLWIRNICPHLLHTLATPSRDIKLSRPSFWITQEVMSEIHQKAFRSKLLASQGWWELEDGLAAIG
jgi:hypothetical protein